MPVNVKEGGLETIIVSCLRDVGGYVEGASSMYDKSLALVKEWLEAFLLETQAKEVEASAIFKVPSETAKFYNRLSAALTTRGVVDILRKGFKYNGQTFKLYYELPSPLNETAKANYRKNRFGVIRQLKYSHVNENTLDFVVFINGLPLATFELKNHFTGQTVDNAIQQYKADRDPKEILLQKKRCAVHFAVDDTDVFMCTELKGAESWFLPFNRGVNGGKGNPVIPGKTMTSYLWEEVFEKRSLSNIIENFAQVITERDKKTGKEKEKVVWPRYHQLDAVRRLLAVTAREPVGRRFLVQHSAGSGKSNTITWLAYQLVLLLDETQQAKFDSIIVVTDRVNLDTQIRDNIHAFARLQNLVGWADHAATLKDLLTGGKKIVVSTIHKFQFILDEIGGALKDKRFAIIIDEAHSSQNGEMASSLAMSVSGNGECKIENGKFGGDGEEDVEDRICRIIKGRKLARNANYYAFTATPKNKTLEMFGERVELPDAQAGFRPFHEYTMRQAIEEGFILDVIRYYTPYRSFYQVVTAQDADKDAEFDKARAPAKIRAFVEKQPETIGQKTAVIVEHFCTKVYKKIGGRARAMVVTSSIERAIEFYKAISAQLEERGGKYKAIVAFTDKEIGGKVHTESMYNGFPSSQIEDRIEEEPYRILIVADKFQTGYDQPLLHTMYVDKVLSGVKAVQTLSRLNRAAPKKADTFVLDFANDPEAIRLAFQQYYKTTVLAGESDVNKLNDLIEVIEKKPFYTAADAEAVVRLRLTGTDADRPQIDAVLDACVARFKGELAEEGQIKVKHAMRTYCHVYPFFASIMPYESPDWERMYVFYSLLVKKLPVLKREDFTEGLLESIDFDKYRLLKEEERAIEMQNEDAEVKPIPTGSMNGAIPGVEFDSLANIVDDFNKEFGGIDWKDADEVRRQIKSLPRRILSSNANFVNTIRQGDTQLAQINFYDGMRKIVAALGEEKIEFMKTYFMNEQFRNMVNDRVFATCLDEIRHDDGGYAMAAESSELHYRP